MRAIDADSLISLVKDSTILGNGFKQAFVAIVKGEPTIELEIIYCKDCVHHIDGFFCRQANHHTSDSDHCASVFRAERREE